jgi:hypothetical protein
MPHETPAPETHRYIGMWRPPFEHVLADHKKVNTIYLEDGGFLYPFGDAYGDKRGTIKLKEYWLAGHFDVPQYVRKSPNEIM